MKLSCAFLILMVFGLGIRHGFDLDHLAIIDSMTRSINSQKPLAKVVGLLFSLGHGLIVMLLSMIIGIGLYKGNFPYWLDGFGNWISVFFLFIFGIINFYNLFKPSHKHPLNFKGYLANILLGKKNQPLLIVFVGALFALSFDTFTQVSLFSLAATAMRGWIFSGILGFIFMLGMMVADGINGFLVALLLVNADNKSQAISRNVGVVISFFSLITCAFNFAKLLS